MRLLFEMLVGTGSENQDPMPPAGVCSKRSEVHQVLPPSPSVMKSIQACKRQRGSKPRKALTFQSLNGVSSSAARRGPHRV